MVSITARQEIVNLMCTAEKSGRTTNCILIYGVKRLIFNSLYSLQKSGKYRLKVINNEFSKVDPQKHRENISFSVCASGRNLYIIH